MFASTLQRRDNIFSLIEDIVMPKIVDHTGKKFGKLLVLGLAGKSGNDRKCFVRCDCGTEKEVVQSKLTAKTKPIKSCGCLAKENHHRTHGLTKHKWYSIWNSMIGRCSRPSHKSYKDYGGRGITICDEWSNDPSVFFEWLESNKYNSNLQIDREDNDKGYNSDNCRIITQKENCNNRRDTKRYNVNGLSLTISEMSEKYDIKYPTLYRRIKIAGMNAEDAIKMKMYNSNQLGDADHGLC